MRKMILLAAMMAIAALMLAAAPAMADDNDRDGRDDVTFRFVGDDFCDIFDCDEDDFCDVFDCNDEDDFCDVFDCNDEVFFDGDGFGDFDQEAESGDVDQSFDVSNTGDNSNQTVGIQGVANTGNAQNQIGVVDADGFGNFDDNNFCGDFFNRHDFCDEDFNRHDFCDEDFNRDNRCDFFDNDRFFDNDGDVEIEDSGASIDVSPTNTVDSSQQVNQAAAASATHHWVWTAWGWMWV